MTTAREEVKEIELSHIRASQGNDRLRDIDTLAKSIAAIGLQIPLIVQHIPDGGDIKGNEKYLLVDGHRRFAALQKNKTKTARVIEIAEDMPGDKMQTIQLTANLHRLQLTAFEEAAAIKNLRDDGRETKDIAADLGMTPQAVARREQLNKLTPEWMKYIANLREGKALSVAAFEMIASYEPSVQGKLLQSYLKSSNVPTVNDVKRELSAFDRTLKSAPWKLDDAILFPAAGACSACPKRSSCQSLLFDGEVDGKKASPEDKCLDIACWNKKLEKFGKQKLAEAQAKHPNLVLLDKNSGWGRGDNRIVGGLSRGNTLIKPKPWSSDLGYEVVRKSDKGAVPAMTINERGLGSISYIKIKKADEPKKPTKADVKKMTPEQVEKQKAEEIAARREQWIREKIMNSFDSRSNPPAHLVLLTPMDVMRLFASALICNDHGKFDGLAKWKNMSEGAALKEIWRVVSESIYVDDWQATQQIAIHLLGLNWSDLEADAVKAIPDAKPKVGAAPEKKAGKK